jgi:hypothetical protein
MRILTKIFLFFVLVSLAASAFAQINLGISIGPPVLRYEVRSAAPTTGAVWIPGYYVYNGGRSDYDWTPGRWQVPPAPRQVWIAPRYRRNGDHYDYYEGSWKQQGKHDNGKHKGSSKHKGR